MKRESSYELLPARPKSNSCYCSVNSGQFFFLKQMNSGGMPPLFAE